MGLSILKSLRLGEMWQFMPESRMKGMDPMQEMGVSQPGCRDQIFGLTFSLPDC